jgi:hypothetical protein
MISTIAFVILCAAVVVLSIRVSRLEKEIRHAKINLKCDIKDLWSVVRTLNEKIKD